MTPFDLVVRGGTVVTPSETVRCDVGIRDGRIAALADRLDGERVLDATGRLVLPGGIDAHVHIDQPRAQGLASGGAVMADDFHSGHALGDVRRHHHDHSVRRPASRPVAADTRWRTITAAPRARRSSTTPST